MIRLPNTNENNNEKMMAMEARKLMNWNKPAPGS
jgi:hypothetical protein